jgi:hypothetical protein
MAEPFSLLIGDDVSVRVVATNIKGSSIESDAGQGAIILTKPDAPVTLAEDLNLRTVSSLGITWA